MQQMALISRGSRKKGKSAADEDPSQTSFLSAELYAEDKNWRETLTLAPHPFPSARCMPRRNQ